MLKPEKWQASFDSEGRVSGFQKALKLIILGVCFYFLLKKLFFIQCSDVVSLFRESIRLLELKFGSFYLVVMS